jgi:sulfite exporter TauE/SafE
MLSSISPVGEASRRQRWWLTALAHLAGSLAGGLAVGAALGAGGALVAARLPDRGAWGLLAVAAALGAALDLAARDWRVPSWRRQVDERWLTSYRGWVYGAGYGLQLGAGAVTIIPATTTYVAALAAVLTGSWMQGAAIGAAFGVMRALPLLLTVRVRTPEALRALLRGWADRRSRAVLLTGTGQLAVALIAVVAVVRW